MRHEFLIENVLYFPQSPINILSVTEFAKQLQDTEGTGVDTKQLRSRFYWNNNKFERTIHHPDSNLPEMQIKEGYGTSSYFTVLVSKVINTATSFNFSCCFTKLASGDPVASVDAAAYATDIKSSTFEVGETLFYTRDGWSGLVKVKSLHIDEGGVLRITVRTSANKEIQTTK